MNGPLHKNYSFHCVPDYLESKFDNFKIIVHFSTHLSFCLNYVERKLSSVLGVMKRAALLSDKCAGHNLIKCPNRDSPNSDLLFNRSQGDTTMLTWYLSKRERVSV